MNASELNPTDVLAQKRRAVSDEPTSAARSRPDSYHFGMLRSESGRADLFRMLRDSGVWSPTPDREEERRDWAFMRAHAAALLDRLMTDYPLAVGLMWTEAMARWEEERRNKQ